MIEISSAIIGKVEAMPECMDYFYIGLVFSSVLAILPIVCRIFNTSEYISLSDAQQFLEDIFSNITQSCMDETKQESLLMFYKKLTFEVFLRTRKSFHSTVDGISW